MIPAFRGDGNLPPGRHSGSWAEILKRFGVDPHRQRLLQGLLRMLNKLKDAGCATAYLDGSFVTQKTIPSDFDGAWDTVGVDLQKLLTDEPLLFDFSNRRAGQKLKYFGEMFPADLIESDTGKTFLEFFETDKQTGTQKGI